MTGSLLVVSCGENQMLLYKENLDGEWIQVGQLNDDGFAGETPAGFAVPAAPAAAAPLAAHAY